MEAPAFKIGIQWETDEQGVKHKIHVVEQIAVSVANLRSLADKDWRLTFLGLFNSRLGEAFVDAFMGDEIFAKINGDAPSQ